MPLTFERLGQGLSLFLYFSGNLMMIHGFRVHYKEGARFWTTLPSNETPITKEAYALSRNPMYLGFLTQLLGVTTLSYVIYPIHKMRHFHFAPLVGLSSFLAFAAMFEIIIVPREERNCQEKWGNMYTVYSNNVNRWMTWNRLFTHDLSKYEIDFKNFDKNENNSNLADNTEQLKLSQQTAVHRA